jgi:hypothetical protein
MYRGSALNGMRTRSGITSSSSVHSRPIGRPERLEFAFVRVFSAGKHRAAAPEQAAMLGGSATTSFRSGAGTAAHRSHPGNTWQLRFASPRLRSRRPEIRAGIDALVTETGADELIVVSDIFDHAKRLRSFELIADVAGIKAEPKPVLMAAASPA